MLPMVEETTGLYGIARQVLEKFRCRIGTKPYIHFVSKFEAVDTTTEEDLKIAEQVGREYWKYNSDLNNKAEVSNINMKKFIGEGYKPLRAYTVIIANGTSNKGGAAA